MINHNSIREHYSQEAERGVLGSILGDNSVLPVVLDHLSVDDFYFQKHKYILRTIIEMQEAGTSIDPVLLADALNKAGKLEAIGGHTFIGEIIESIPSPALAENYCKTIKDHSTTRKVIEAAQRIEQRANDITLGTVDDLLSFAQQEVMKATLNYGTERTDIHYLAKEAFRQIEERYKSGGALPGLVTGFKALDNILGGLRAGCVYVVAARPGNGKTVIALNIARNVTETGKRAVFFSLELGHPEVLTRMFAAESGVDSRNIERGLLDDDKLKKVAVANDKISRLPFDILDDAANLSPINRIAARARRLKADKDISMIIVDYLQLVEPSQRWNIREQAVSEVSRSLKALAKELKVPIIAAAQLNREGEKRPNKEPTLADLRESGAIEQDADAVILLSPVDEQSGLTDLFIKKNRQGPIGKIQLFFKKEIAKFVSVTSA